jgi:galactokinase
MMGRKNQLIRLDCRTLEYQYEPCNLDGYKILLLNTNVKHSLATSEYNNRRKECSQAVEWIQAAVPGIDSLRDVNEQMLDLYVKPKSELIDRRSRFIVQEIMRVQQASEDLANADLKALGKKMFATHDGLSKMYEVSCRELDFLVDAVRDHPAVTGARMMGGGFGGCTINIVREDAIESLVANIKPAYEKEMDHLLTYYVASIENGTEILA